jgi:hypothetical protein
MHFIVCHYDVGVSNDYSGFGSRTSQFHCAFADLIAVTMGVIVITFMRAIDGTKSFSIIE